MRPNDYDNFLVNIRCSDEFRECMEKALSTETGEMPSGEKNIKIVKAPSKFRAGNIAAMAAAIAIVFGAGIAVNHLLSGSGEGPFLPGGDAEVTEEPETTEAVTEAKDEEQPEVTEEVQRAETAGVKECVLKCFGNQADDIEVVSFNGKAGTPLSGEVYYNSARYRYSVPDPDKMAESIIDLEWTECSEDEFSEGMIDDEVKGTKVLSWGISSSPSGNYILITANGYFSGGGKYFRLVNESDCGKINDIFFEYIRMTPESLIAEQIHSGVHILTNLRADYKYERNHGYSDDSVPDELNGSIYYMQNSEGNRYSSDMPKEFTDSVFYGDEGKELMYVTGEGTFDNKSVSMDLIMNGEKTAYSTQDTETGEKNLENVYWYNCSLLDTPKPGNQYFYLCKKIEEALTSYRVKTEGEIESVELENDITEYHFILRTGNGGKDSEEYTIQLLDRGILVAYECRYPNGYYESFKLDNYEINSDSFEMDTEEIKAKYDAIEAACNEQNKRNDEIAKSAYDY